MATTTIVFDLDGTLIDYETAGNLTGGGAKAMIAHGKLEQFSPISLRTIPST